MPPSPHPTNMGLTKDIMWKAMTFLCSYLSLCGVVTSLCLTVSSLCLEVTSVCLVVTSLCGLFIIDVMKMWCGFVFMFCWLHFRYKALTPRLYSLLATSQTGFKRGLNSCSFAFLLISVWRENITKSIPKDLKLESLIPKLSLKMYQSCPMTSLCQK